MLTYCRFEDYKTRATFGIKGTKVSIYCAKHKETEHVDIKNKRCLKYDKRPSYGEKVL